MTEHPAFESWTEKGEAALRSRNGDAPPPGEPARADGPRSSGTEQAKPLPPLKIIRPEEWRGREIPERKFIVPGMIPCGVVTGLYGPPGKGKSTLAMQLQAATASGVEWCGRIVEPVKSIGVYCEDDEDELMRRWRRIDDHMQIGIDDARNARMISRLGEDNILATFTRAGKIELTPLHKQLVELAKDECAELVIFDTVSDGFAGNENDRTQVRQFVQSALATIARDVGGAVMFLAHPSRTGMSDGSGQSGSTAWEGTVRSRLFFRDEDAPDGAMPDKDARVLSVVKANYAASGIDIPLRYHKGLFLPERPTGEASFRPPVEDVFLALMDKFERQARTISHKPRAYETYAPTQFSRDSERHGYSKSAFEAAMRRLFDTKKIEIVKEGPPSRAYEYLRKVNQ